MDSLFSYNVSFIVFIVKQLRSNLFYSLTTCFFLIMIYLIWLSEFIMFHSSLLLFSRKLLRLFTPCGLELSLYESFNKVVKFIIGHLLVFCRPSLLSNSYALLMLSLYQKIGLDLSFLLEILALCLPYQLFETMIIIIFHIGNLCNLKNF